MAATVILPANLGSLPPEAGGDAQLWPLLESAMARGLVVDDSNADHPGMDVLAGITRFDLLTWAAVQLVYSKGGEVLQWPAWVRLSAAQLSVSVPVYVPASTTLIDPNDPDAGTRQMTWNEYPRTKHDEADGNNVQTGNSLQETSDGNDHWPASVLVQLASNGYTIIQDGQQVIYQPPVQRTRQP